MRCRYLSAEIRGDRSTQNLPDFDDWIETDSWQTVEGQFVGIGVLPEIVVDGCAPTGGARTAAGRASSSRRKDGAKIDGAWLTWVFCPEDNGGDESTITRSDLEHLQRTYSPAAVGKQATAKHSVIQREHELANDTAKGQTEPLSLSAEWNEERVLAFSIECREQVRPY